MALCTLTEDALVPVKRIRDLGTDILFLNLTMFKLSTDLSSEDSVESWIL